MMQQQQQKRDEVKHNTLFVVFFLSSIVKQLAIFANASSEWGISFSNFTPISTISMV